MARCAAAEPCAPGLALLNLLAGEPAGRAAHRKFLEKFHGKPFGHGPTERMSVDELTEGLTEFEDWFSFIVPSRSADDRTTFGVDEMLKACEAHFRMQGTWRNSEVKKGLVIDPWNELEHLAPEGAFRDRVHLADAFQNPRNGRARVACTCGSWRTRRSCAADENGKLPVPKPDMISRLAALVEQGRQRDHGVAPARRADEARGADPRAEGSLQARRPARCHRPDLRPGNRTVFGAAAQAEERDRGLIFNRGRGRKELTMEQVDTDKANGKGRGRRAAKTPKDAGRMDENKQPMVKKPQIVAERLDELVELANKASTASERAKEAVTKCAEDSGFLASAVNKLVRAKAGDKFEEKHREVEQQKELFDEAAE
jgi:hypothetical protein